MSAENAVALDEVGIPESDRPILGRRRDQLAVGAIGHGPDEPRVSAQHRDQLAVGRIPQPKRLVVRDRTRCVCHRR